MQDIALHLEHRPGALADVGRALEAAGISIEGGGAWICGNGATAHFLFRDGAAARHALESAGIRVIAVRDVVLLRLRQGVPGQLGALCRRMADAGINIEVQYSDHDHRLVLVVDDAPAARAVAAAWECARGGGGQGGGEARQ